MTLKEEFLSIKTYEEYDSRRNEFKGLDVSDPEILKHYGEIFPKLKTSGIENGIIYDVFT